MYIMQLWAWLWLSGSGSGARAVAACGGAVRIAVLERAGALFLGPHNAALGEGEGMSSVAIDDCWCG